MNSNYKANKVELQEREKQTHFTSDVFSFPVRSTERMILAEPTTLQQKEQVYSNMVNKFTVTWLTSLQSNLFTVTWLTRAICLQ